MKEGGKVVGYNSKDSSKNYNFKEILLQRGSKCKCKNNKIMGNITPSKTSSNF